MLVNFHGPYLEEWTIQMKNAGVGYTTLWPETEQRGLPMFGRAHWRPAGPHTNPHKPIDLRRILLTDTHTLG
jgi:hypothetical protein